MKKVFYLFLLFAIYSCNQKGKQTHGKAYHDSIHNAMAAKLSRQDFDGAMKDVNDALDADSNDAGAYFIRASIELHHNKNYSALNDFNKSISLDSGKAVAYRDRAILEFQGFADTVDAIYDMDKAVELSPRNTEYLGFRAFLEDTYLVYKLAIRDYSKILALTPNVPEIIQGKGIDEVRIHEYDSAIQDFSYAIKLNPNDTNSYYDRGLAEQLSGGYTAALKDFSKAIELNPGLGAAYFHRGMVLISLHKKNSACDDMFKSKKLGYVVADSVINRYCKS